MYVILCLQICLQVWTRLLKNLCQRAIKACLSGFDFCPTFLSKNLPNECWGCLNRSVTLLKVVKNMQSLSNGSQIKKKKVKFEFDQTFSRLPFDFSFVFKKVGSCRNCLNTSSNFCLTVAQHSFDTAQMNVE